MAVKILPNNRPAWSREDVESIIHQYGIIDSVVLIGKRGYFRDSLGAVGRNDLNIYDDAIAVISPTAFASFNANVDPSITRPRVATLVNGIWRYKPGIHNLSKAKSRQYPAFVQAGDVTVKRHGVTTLDTGRFGINIHKGSYTTTSSLGCQTIYPAQWDAFYSLVVSELKRHNQKTFPYLLIEGQG